ncbi:MAG: murein biosynthesis integral membrane protein MurJ [Nitrolancea sp.]
MSRIQGQSKRWRARLARLLAILFPAAAQSEPEFGWNRPTTWSEHRRHSRLRRLFVREFSIPEATLLLMAAFLFSAVLGSVRQILLNALFGTGEAANAYYAAFRLPDALFSLIAGGALSSAMIPILLSTEREDGRVDWERLFNLVLTGLFAALVVVVIAGEMFAPFFVHRLLAPGFDAETSHLTITLTRIMLAQPLILAAGSVASAVLNSRRQFTLTAISFASHNVAIISGIAVSWLVPAVGIYGPTVGVLGGAVLQMILLIPGIRDNGLHVHIAWDPHSVRLRQVIRLLIPNGLSVGVGYAGFIVDTAFASKVPGTLALPAIQNAWLLVALPISLLGQGVGQAAFPRLAAHAAAARWKDMRRTLLWSIGAVVALAIPALIGLGLFGRILIRLLFEHGKFSAAAGTATYHVLLIYVLSLPFAVATELVTRGLISLRDTRTPLLTNTLQLAGRVAITAALLDRYGVEAIPTAYAVSAAIETVLLTAILLPRIQRRIKLGRAGI